MKIGLTGNMKLYALALAAGVAFAVYKNDLANKLLNSPALGLGQAPPAPAPVAAQTVPPMAPTTTPMGSIDPNTGLPITTQQPIYPAAPTGIQGAPSPLLSSLPGMRVLPSATIPPPAGQYPIGNSPYAPFPFQVSTPSAGSFPYGPGYPPYPYLPPQSLPPGYTIPNINQVQQLPPFQHTSAPPGNRIDFYNPANPPSTTTSPTTTGSTTSSVAYAHLGAKSYKAGKFGSMRDSAFQISPLSQDAISISYRRPGFYAPETLSNI